MHEERAVTEHRGATFDEELLSGYLDGELTQAEEQRVRLHLEDHPEAEALLEEMKRMRHATLSTAFKLPDDRQWDERPRGTVSLLARGAGWLLTLVWLAAVVAFGLWQLATSPESLVVKLLAFGALAGLALLFLSVLLDRLRDLPGDRYRRVFK
jgi:anti-sigma factor RsiW